MSDKPVLKTPGQWLAEIGGNEGIAKLAVTLAGLDPLDEESEPIDRAAYDALIDAARKHLGEVKTAAKTRGINPVRVRVVSHPGMLLAAIFACPDALVMAKMIAPEDDGHAPDVARFNQATATWTQHALWPTVGTPDYERIQEGYSGAWYMLSICVREVFGMSLSSLKKRA